jgi:hypothetical protein
MRACSFDRLAQLVNMKLDLDEQLVVYYHLERCDICRDAVYEISRDRDEAFFTYRSSRAEPSILQGTRRRPSI